MNFNEPISKYVNNEYIDHIFHILHIETDDVDANQLSFYAHSIENFDIMVHRVRSTSDALKQLHLRPFDLCIVDFCMPASYPSTIMDEISQAQENLPVLVLSHMTNDLFVDESITWGADYVLGKSELSVSTLLDAIEHTLHGNGLFRQRRPNRRAAPRPVHASGLSAGDEPGQLLDDHSYNSLMPDTSHRGVHQPERSKALMNPQKKISTRHELEQLRSDVAVLHYELAPQCKLIAPEHRQCNREVLYVADLIRNSIHASLTILDRKRQTCSFDDNSCDMICNADPVDTMIILSELLRSMARNAKSSENIQIHLTRINGRTSVLMEAASNPNAVLKSADLDDWIGAYFRPDQFTCFVEREKSGKIKMLLRFPFLLH